MREYAIGEDGLHAAVEGIVNKTRAATKRVDGIGQISAGVVEALADLAEGIGDGNAASVSIVTIEGAVAFGIAGHDELPCRIEVIGRARSVGHDRANEPADVVINVLRNHSPAVGGGEATACLR